MADSLFDLRGSLDSYAYIKEQEGFTTNGKFVDPTKDLDSAIMLSCTREFKIDRRSEVTNYPVAKTQSSSSDHVREYGAKITLDGIITDSLFGLAEFLFSAQKAKNTEEIVEELKKLQKSRKLVSVHLPDGLTVNNCVITQTTFTREKNVANGFIASISLQELLITEVTPTEVKAESVENQAAKDSPKGVDTGQGGALSPVQNAAGVVTRF